MKRKLFVLTLVIILSVLGIASVVLDKPVILKTDSFIINARETGIVILDRMHQQGFIDGNSKSIMRVFLKLSRSRFRFGEYLLERDMSILSVVSKLCSGDVYYRQIVFPEGSTTAEIIKIIKEEKNLLGELSDVAPEGVLMPDTYYFTYGEIKDDLVKRMKDAMRNFLDKEWLSRDPGLPVRTAQEALILASIVEKESGNLLEQPKVAGVFYNRLRRGMRLQSDPTSVYNVTRGYWKLDRTLTAKAIRMQGVYNTYRNAGLPPTPISNPGRSAILAVLHPDPHKALFFILDLSGNSHIFSDTYADHLAQVQKIRRASRRAIN